jgi:hypothetical protein
MRRLLAACGLLLVCTIAAPAQDFSDGRYPQITQGHVAAHRAHSARRSHKAARPVINPVRDNSSLITVPTAAGIDIKVAASFAPKIVPFIAALVARGYHPTKIHCYSGAASHVANSLHHTGQACDFNQRGWGKTDAPMYHVADLARQFGLRDGCAFRDCGHIDSGRREAHGPDHNLYAAVARFHHRHRRYAIR